MKYAIKITFIDGTEPMCVSVQSDNTEIVRTWDNAGTAEAQALKIRDHSPRGTRTKVVVWNE